MFAIIRTGGKQYRVGAGDMIVVEKLASDDGKVSFADVLMVADGEAVTLGAPVVPGASVAGEVLEQRKGEKTKVFKKRRRNTYRRKRGHRQLESVVRITAIAANGKTVKAEDKAKDKAAKPKRARAKKSAPAEA